MTPPRWRPLAPADLDAVMAIAGAVHPAYPESRAAFASRLERFPRGCRVLATGSAVEGYAFAHPAMLDRPPRLDSILGPLPDAPQVLHLHDMALLPHRRGAGQAGRLLADLRILAAELGLARLSLVAVAGAEALWRRHGFAPRHAPDPELRAALESYGGGLYMTAPT